MQKKFVENIVLLVLANLLVKPLYIFAIERVVQNEVGEAQYGLYFSLFNIALVGQVLLDFGINNFNSRTIAQQPELLSNYLSAIIPVKVFLSVLYLLLCYFGAYYLGYNSEQLYWLFFLALSQIMASFSLYIRSNLQGLHWFRVDSILSIADRLLLVILGLLWLGFSEQIHIRQFIYLQTFAYFMAALLGIYYLFKALDGPIIWRLDGGLVRSIARQTYPYALLALFIAGNSRMESVWLNYWLSDSRGAYEAGVYAQSYRLLDAANMIAVLFATILMPTFSRLLHQGESIDQLAGFSGRLMLAGSGSLAIVSYFFAQSILDSLYIAVTPESVRIFHYLSLSFVATASCYVYGTLLTAKGKIGLLNRIAATVLLLNGLMDYVLIRHDGAVGAAQATFVTQFITATAYLVWSIRTCHLSTTWVAGSKIIVFLLGTAVMSYVMSLLAVYWLMAWLLAMSLAVLWSAILGLWDWRALWVLIQSKEH